MSIKDPERQRTASPAGRFAHNAFWLIAVNLFMRTVGVSFNIYLAGRAGNEVMGLHSLLTGVYGLAMTVGCGGIHLGTTRLIAEALGKYAADTPEGAARQEAAIRSCLKKCLLYATLCGTGAGILLLLGAPWVGRVWLGDPRTVISLRILAITLLPLALSNCLSGYFTGMRRVGMSSTAGVLSQFVRLLFCVVLIEQALPDGIQSTCQALVLGGALSEGVGLALSFGAFCLDRHLHRNRDRQSPAKGGSVSGTDGTSGLPSSRSLTGHLLHITVPVTLAACLRSGLVTLEHALIPRGLASSGASWASALSSYGVLHGVVLPVVLFPSAFISSFSGLLVPEVAECRAAGNRIRIARIARRVVSPALVFSFGVAGMMACFAGELGELVCGSQEAGEYIRALAPLIPIMYVDSSVDGILKGMGEQVYSMTVNIIDALVSVILVWLLLPRMGLDGFILTIYVTETLNTTLSLCRMLRISKMPVSLWRMVFGPLLCVVLATWAIKGLFTLIPGPDGLPGLILHLSAGAFLYLILLIPTRVLGKQEADDLRRLLLPRHDSAPAPAGCVASLNQKEREDP